MSLKTKLSKETSAAVRRYGPSVNTLARRRYHVSGKQLLARLVVGESGDDPNAVSSAGARGRTQFIPSTRAAVKSKFGIDPWGSADEAVHAAALHLRGKLGNAKGLEGYNPGDPSYPSYILSKRAKLTGKGGGGSLRSKMSSATSSAAGSFSAGAATQVLAEPEQRPAIPTSSLQAPSFSAQAPVAQGYAPVDAGGGPAARPSLSDAISAQGQSVSFSNPAQQKQSSGAVGSSSSRRGKVKIEAGADRPGVPTNPEVTDFLKGVAGRTGRTVRIGTGSRHSQMTVNGNVSDHWSGRAADVPATGQRLIELGQAALQEAGWSRRRARKAKGGLYNVRVRGKRVQIIFATHEGGDHTTHLHVGFGE